MVMLICSSIGKIIILAIYFIQCKRIELGCFDALAKNHLKMIKFGIYLDPTKPRDMAEVFTVNIDYSKNGTKKFNSAQFNYSNNDGHNITTSHTLSATKFCDPEKIEFERTTNSLFKKIC